MRWRAPWVLIVALIATPGQAGCRLMVKPLSVRELPREQYAAARSVAWRDEKRLLIGTRGNGIIEYDVAAGSGKTLISGEALPHGIDDVEKLDTDGKTVVAFNRDRVDVAFDLQRRKFSHTRRAAIMRIADLAVRDGNVAVLGYSFSQSGGGGPVWFGRTGAGWDEHTLAYTAKDQDAFHRTAFPPYAGAIRFLDANTAAFITPAAPGVFRVRTDGTSLPPLGRDMTELVADVSAALRAPDLPARYAQLNKLLTIDDLVVLPEGPAVIVRGWTKGKTHWQLWRVHAEKQATEKVVLDVSDARTVGAHLRCDAWQSRLACITDEPRLMLFDVAKPTKTCEK